MDICLIPARSGSKRLKNKNIISFFGKPMISYSIKTAIKCNLFKKIIVSTDSNKIAKISKKYGAEISNDFASDYDVIEHFINYAKAKNLKIRFLCYLYPVNPLLKISTLKKCKKKIIEAKCKKIVTIGKYSHPVQRALIKDKLGNIFYKEKNNTNKRSQNLNTLYHDAAQCYWYDLRKIKNIRNVANQTKSIELKKFEFLDVDTSEDFNNLKKIFKFNLHK